MELRSTRSRSKTPFAMSAYENFNTVSSESGNHVEKTYVKSSKKTTVYRTLNAHATSSTDEVTEVVDKPMRRSTRSERNSKRLYKTSDYSSEDGENEVTSTKIISQNEKNQLIEDARAAANGNSEISALELYKKSGRYWDVYPKTDWTYSHHSRDRVELAPGIIAMPNMSRKTIHSVHDMSTGYIHKQTNTEDTLSKTNSTFTTTSFKPRQLFNNNYDSYTSYETVYNSSYWSRTKRTITTIFMSILNIFLYMFEVQTSWFAKIHQFTSRIMLLDTWLLKKVNLRNKPSKIALLVLIPLLLLGGWYLLSTIGSSLYGAYLNTTVVGPEDSRTIVNIPQKDLDGTGNNVDELFQTETSEVTLDKYKSNIIPSELSAEQLASLMEYLKLNWNNNQEEIDLDALVRSVIKSPIFQSILNEHKSTNNNHLNQIIEQNNVITEIQGELNTIRQDITQAEKQNKEELLKMFSKIEEQNRQKYEHLSVQLRQCCRKSVINIENHVHKILTDFLNDPNFLKNQHEFIKFMKTIFVAKEMLESNLKNLTSSLDSKYDGLIAENSKIIMDDVGRKIQIEITKEVTNSRTKDIRENGKDSSLTNLSDIQIKKIVKNALAIYDADRTGLVDYAMETMGGQILTTRCTENYHYGKAVVSVLGIPLWYPVNSPRTVITPTINPGECWAFQNFPGFIVIQLSNMVEIEAFSLEHISKLLVPNGKIDSAPKEFEVYGLKVENDREPVKLGQFVYDYDGEPLQFFEVIKSGYIFDIIELRIISNHGNPNYTCLYRFRVHGKLSTENS